MIYSVVLFFCLCVALVELSTINMNIQHLPASRFEYVSVRSVGYSRFHHLPKMVHANFVFLTNIMQCHIYAKTIHPVNFLLGDANHL